MKKLFAVLLVMSVMLSLSPAMGEGLVKGPPTPPPFARDEDGAVVVENNRAPVVVSPQVTRKPTATAAPLVAVDPSQPVLIGGEMVDLGGMLYVDVQSTTAYARAKESPISITAQVSGGMKPYTLHFTVENDGVAVHDSTSTISAAGLWSMSYQPAIGGKHTVEVTVSDASGAEYADAVEINVAENAAEGPAIWKKSVSTVQLTGDWRVDIVAIAQTQIGYQESAVDFVYDDEGVKHGYTRYGDWYGSKYGDWCATFIAFCCEYANIPKGLFPRAALVQDLMDALDDMGAGEDYRYLPMVGDIVFFSTEGDYAPEHVGIIENVSGSSIYTIEGNSSDQVRRREYALDAEEIVGYGNVSALMRAAGLIAEDDVQQTIEIPDTAIGVGYTVKADVNMRAEPAEDSRFIKRIGDKGTEVTVLIGNEDGEDVWYFVKYKDNIGYVRGDLLQVVIVSAEEIVCTCGAVPDAEGAVTHSEDCDITAAELLKAWIAETNPTTEMIERAKLAASLESLVLEGENLVYVRTGEVIATYNAETNALVDLATGEVIGFIIDDVVYAPAE